jgi:hypothetical protein
LEVDKGWASRMASVKVIYLKVQEFEYLKKTAAIYDAATLQQLENQK